MSGEKTFETELTNLINRHSMESASNTPDFILAQYIAGCLAAFAAAVQQRETWYGRDGRPSPSCGSLRFVFNGTEIEISDPEVTYEQLAVWAGGGLPSITWSDKQGRSGIVWHGSTLHITSGMTINAIRTGNA